MAEGETLICETYKHTHISETYVLTEPLEYNRHEYGGRIIPRRSHEALAQYEEAARKTLEFNRNTELL